jgi:hypothetical protein
MKFKTHNDKEVNTGGTSLVGTIDINFNKLFEVFGEPTGSDGYKSDAEWEIEFEDGTVGTIYNWKDGINYNGDDGTPTEEITHWHIGGNSKEVISKIKSVLFV